MLEEIYQLRLGNIRQTGDECYYNICTVPNLITISSYFTLGSYIYSVISGNILLLGLSLFWCFFSDGLDGEIARRFNQHSWLGIRIDPIRDRLLFLVLIWHVVVIKGPEAWHWQLGVILLIEFLVIVGAVFLSKPHKTIQVSILGKLRHLVTVVLLSLIIFDSIYGSALLDSVFQTYYRPIANLCQQLEICYTIMLALLAVTAVHYGLIAKKII
jgi:cardiolipin synthase (CMP-forming)